MLCVSLRTERPHNLKGVLDSSGVILPLLSVSSPLPSLELLIEFLFTFLKCPAARIHWYLCLAVRPYLLSISIFDGEIV